MFEVGQSVRYTPKHIGATGRSKFSKVAAVTARKVTLEDGTGWTLDGKEWGAGRPTRGWPYAGARLVKI